MKKILALFTLIFASTAFAHDEGHGPKLTDSPKQGGVLAPVVKATEANKQGHASVIYKAELVRSEDGTARVYLYDREMNALPSTSFEKTVKAVLEAKKKGKWLKTSFELKFENDHFMGKAPQSPAKPFNIDVMLKEGSQSYLVSFQNLD